MAPVGACELKTKSTREPEKVMERQILGTVKRFPEQFVRIHEDPDKGILRDCLDSSFGSPF